MKSSKVDFDFYAESYDQHIKKGTAFFSEDHSYFADYKVSIFALQIKRIPKKLLEYGCGTGRNIPFLKRAFPGSCLSGSDISKESIRIAQKHCQGTSFFVEPSKNSNHEYFDAIFIAGVFHHVTPNERPALVQELRKRLEKGGDLFIFEHNPYNAVTRRIVQRCPFDADAVLLSRATLHSLLTAGGLRVISAGYCLFFPPTWRIFKQWERYLTWLPLGGQYWIRATVDK